MRSRPCSLLLGLLLSLLTLQAAAKQDEPAITVTEFDGEVNNLVYFDDSDVALVLEGETHAQRVLRSVDGGLKWSPLEDVKEGQAIEVLRHNYDNKVAVILGSDKTHWITRDRGETWKSFETETGPSPEQAGIAFHAEDSDRMLYFGYSCIPSCRQYVYYTTDGFKSPPKLLDQSVSSCLWAKSTDVFTTGDKDLDRDTLLCIEQGTFFFESASSKVLVTSDYFKTPGTEPTMSDQKPVRGVTNIAAVKRYIVFAAKSEHTVELSMQVTTDTKTWHRAELGEHRLEEGAYTLLESTNYSMQVDVVNGSVPIGVLLTSESNGTYFSKSIAHTNRSPQGFVDFEKVSNIQGIVIVNVVDNWEDSERLSFKKELKSRISFDDGRTWSTLRAGEDDLHLHSVTEQRNIGRMFSSPAPGIVMGNGNTGKYLHEYEEADLYVSHDAGMSWTLAKENPHMYEFGASGSVLLAVEQGETDEIQWSLNYGKDWTTTKVDQKFRPFALTTTTDSTSLKFLMLATLGRGARQKYVSIALDFADLHERECKDSDFEDWHARVYDNGDPQCIMGHTQSFRRRKLDADCLVVSKNFEDPKMDAKDCECTKADFECDYDFVREDGEDSACVPISDVRAGNDECKKGEDTFKGPSGYRLIPGNTCKGGVQLDKESKEWSCDQLRKPKHGSGKITKTKNSFHAQKFLALYYLERGQSSHGDDETIIMLDSDGVVWRTTDHGKEWNKLLPDKYRDEEIIDIYPHQYFNEFLFLVTSGKRVIYSRDRGETLADFDVPEPPNRDRLQYIQFHPKEEDWLIWTGSTDCQSRHNDCTNVAYVSKKRGMTWEPLHKGVRKCMFVYREERKNSENLVYCEIHEGEDRERPISLWSSNDWFDTKTELKKDVINYATMAEYIVVALRDDDKKSLKVDASIDGVTFADAQFPRNFAVDHQQAYTVLDSSTHAVFLHVTVNPQDGQEYGSILKSNSNGTSYVLTASEVNRNSAGYVDFEKMQGLEGVALINRVANADAGAKKLKTWITHNDGAGWALLPRPKDPPKDVREPFECQGSGEKCSLHLHGYTERTDPSETFSSPTAIGIMIAAGNVGEYLLPNKNDADTFITTDGGISWRLIRKGNWMWEFGDQGSVIVIVKDDQPTKSVLYSLDEGTTWTEYEFDENEMVVEKISTVPSDNSLNFLLRGKIKGELVTINLDFSGLTERSEQCKLDEDDPNSSDGDYELWSPKHPLLDNECLFGHVARYIRKRPDRDCYNGREIARLHSRGDNCACTREDFECDYNYQRGANNECELVPGAEPPPADAVCRADPKLVEYYDVTGYRRIPLTTCEGGRELDFTSRSHPCPNHEDDYQKKHGISAAGLFFAIVLPIAAAAAVGFWIYRSWDGKFGRIRLGDSGGAGGGGRSLGSSGGAAAGLFDRDAPWVRYPVLALSGVVAVVATLPMLVGSLWRAVSTRLGRRGGSGGIGVGGAYSQPFTSRGSFARGRGNYAVLDPDDAELLGDESDEEA